MYYENPEVNDDRQYADFCLDNNGKSIFEEENGNLFLTSKKNIEKAAKEHQDSFSTYNGCSAIDGYGNGKHKQSYDSFIMGSYFILKHINTLMIDFAEYYYSYWSLSDYFPEGKTTIELLKQFFEGRGLSETGLTIDQQRSILSLFAIHYNKLGRKDYIGGDDVTDFSPMVQSFIGVDEQSIDDQIYEFEQWIGRDHPAGITFIYKAETIWD